MKNILLSLMLMSCFVGCSYSTSKSIYINSKKIVVENWDEIPEDIQNKLIKIDEKAKEVDKIKNIGDEVKDIYVDSKKKDVEQAF